MLWDLTDAIDNPLLKQKMRSDDRIFVLRPKEGGSKATIGIVDHRLFKGENNLHAIRDPETALWYMRYDKGTLPPVLKGQFTNFKDLYKLAETYFKSRNVEIIEVQD